MPLSPEMTSILAQGTGFFVTLIRVTAKASKGGDVIAYALGSRDVEYDETVFKAMPFEPSKMAQNAGTEVDNATIRHLLGELFSKLKIRGGKWSGARIELMAVDILNLSAGPARQHFGRVGDVTTMGKEAQTELRGLMQLLSQEIGDRTSRLCRYTLGDEDCGKDLTAFTFAGTVVTVHNNQRITVNVDKPNDYFKYGKCTFTSGENEDLEVEIISNAGQVLTLWLPMPYEIAIGDSVSLIAGDDKTIETCHGKFNNAINIGSEPSIPKRDDVYRFPD